MSLEKGWTEYELAERSELTHSTISSWYRNKLIPSIPSLEHICNAFGISLSQFFLKDNCFFRTPASSKPRPVTFQNFFHIITSCFTFTQKKRTITVRFCQGSTLSSGFIFILRLYRLS